jgi:hypothetical protein
VAAEHDRDDGRLAGDAAGGGGGDGPDAAHLGWFAVVASELVQGDADEHLGRLGRQPRGGEPAEDGAERVGQALGVGAGLGRDRALVVGVVGPPQPLGFGHQHRPGTGTGHRIELGPDDDHAVVGADPHRAAAGGPLGLVVRQPTVGVVDPPAAAGVAGEAAGVVAAGVVEQPVDPARPAPWTTGARLRPGPG